MALRQGCQAEGGFLEIRRLGVCLSREADTKAEGPSCAAHGRVAGLTVIFLDQCVFHSV